MKVPFQQRTWIQNFSLVFRLCVANFVPLFLVMFVCSLPYLFLYQIGGARLEGRFSISWLLGPSLNSDWSILGLIIRPIRQAFSLYIVARCFEGVRVPLIGGLRHCVRSLPALIAYSLMTTIGLSLIMVPGCIVGFMTMSPFVFFIASGIPFVLMYSCLVLGPAVVVVEGKGPIIAMEDSVSISRHRRLYLLAFLGVLLLPTLAASLLSWTQPPMTTWDPETHRVVLEPFWFLTLRGAIANVLDMPATIGPAVLYFQFKASVHRIPAARLAALVDQVGERHDDEGE